MKKDFLRRSIFYRHRVLWGFIAFSVFAVLFAGYNFWQLPAGLTESEMSAAAISGHWSPFALSISPEQLVNLPWNFLQSISIGIFGLSTFSIRLPAVVLMCLAAMVMFFLIKKWSRFSLAMIGGFLMITSVLFISLARNGTPASAVLFLMTLALAAATTVVIDKRPPFIYLTAKIIVGVCLALLIYFPGGMYITAAIVLAGLLHPKVRLLLVRTKTWKMLLAGLLGLVLLLPLILTISLRWHDGGSAAISTLLLFDGQWSIANLATSLDALFGVQSGLNHGVITPIITIVGLLLVVLGILRALADASSARSYLVLSALVMAVMASWRQPGLAYLFFLPIVLLTALGMEVLISKWYSLFPRNPYARGIAVVMLSVLVTTLSFTSLNMYLSTQNYNSAVVYGYNLEFRLARQEVRQRSQDNLTLVVSDDQLEFYKLLQNDFPHLTVTNKLPKDQPTTLVLASSGLVKAKQLPAKIITSWHSIDPVLIRVY